MTTKYRGEKRVSSSRLSSWLDFLNRHIICVFTDNRIGHFPHLDQVVLRGAAEHPRVVQIPAEIRNAIRVATVHEESTQKTEGVSLGRTVREGENGKQRLE